MTSVQAINASQFAGQGGSAFLNMIWMVGSTPESSTSTESSAQALVGHAFTLSQTRIYINGGVGSAACNLQSRINAATGNITLAVGGSTAVRTIQDTTHTDSILQNDLVNLKFSNTSNAYNVPNVHSTFTTTDHPYHIYAASGTGTVTWSTSGTYPFIESASLDGRTTEAQSQSLVRCDGVFDQLSLHVVTPNVIDKPQIVAVYRYVQAGDTTALPDPFTAGSTFQAWTLAELSGMTGTFANDLRTVKQNQINTGATLTTATATTSDNNNLALLAVANYDGTAAMTIPSGYTSDINDFNNANYGSWFLCHESFPTSGSSVGGDAITMSSSTHPSAYTYGIFGAAGQSPAVVQSQDGSATSGHASSITLGSSPTVGNLIVVFAFWRDGSVAAPTVNTAGGWTQFSSTTQGDSSVTQTVTFRKNASNGNQTVSVSGSTTGWITDTTHSDSVVSGDLVNSKAIASATGSNNAYNAILNHFVSGHNSYDSATASDGPSASASTRYLCLFGYAGGSSSFGTTTEAIAQTLMSSSGTASFLRSQFGNGSASSGGTLTFRNNAASGNQTVVVSTTHGTFYEDTTHSDNYLSSDLLCHQIVSAGTMSDSQTAVKLDGGGGSGGQGNTTVIIIE